MQFKPLVTVILLQTVIISSCSQSPKRTNLEVSSEDKTTNCLVGYDWVYPSGTNPTGAWKFNSDGTFNSSTTMFGGMSTWGTWSISQPNQVSIHYTKTTEGYLPEDQVLIIDNCDQLIVGATIYVRD